MRHADLRREATAVIAKPASALLHDTAAWYLVWVFGRVGVCLVVGRAMRWVQHGSASRKIQSKKVESKKLFFACLFRLCKQARFGL